MDCGASAGDAYAGACAVSLQSNAVSLLLRLFLCVPLCSADVTLTLCDCLPCV
jgi:hypothetical protein